MTLVAWNEDRQRVLASRVRRADTFVGRLKGLLGERALPPGAGLLLVPCRSVHSIGMAFDIDVVHLDRAGAVLAAYTLPRGRFGPTVRQGHMVLELPAGTVAETGTRPGDRVHFHEGEMTMDVRQFFTAHAKGYTESASHARGADLDLLLNRLAPKAGERALDLATGSGHTALRLLQAGLEVVAVDLTPAMLAEAEALAAAAGQRLATVIADVRALPFPDGSFDIATCRRAAHHFPDVPGFLAEARRVLKPGGRIGIVDMSPPPAAAALVDRLERLRDASHVHALSTEEWRAAMADAGFEGVEVVLEREVVDLDRWLFPVTPAEVDLAAIERLLAEASPDERAALELHRADGRWVFTKARAVVVGRTPST